MKQTTILKRSMKFALVTTAALVTIGSAWTFQEAHAARRGQSRDPGSVLAIETPLGLYGTKSNTPSIQVALIVERGGRVDTRVELEAGWDRNGDGQISDEEFEPAHVDRRDSRNTGRSRSGKKFRGRRNPGERHVFVWDTLANVEGQKLLNLQFAHTPQGRRIVDPNNPSRFLLDASQQGIQLRGRGVRGKGRRTVASDWVYSDTFSIDNASDHIPVIDFAGIAQTQGEELDINGNVLGLVDVVAIDYTVQDADNEDADGNGVLDNGEDTDFDGMFDIATVGMAFDYYRLGFEQTVGDLAGLNSFEIDALSWRPCTRFDGTGAGASDPDTDLVANVQPTPYRFSWFASLDQNGDLDGTYVLRARAYDNNGRHTGYRYYLDGITLTGTQND